MQRPDSGRMVAGTDSRPNDPTTSGVGGVAAESPPFPVPDHTLIRRVGKGSYGEVWLARNALGTWRAVKIVRRSAFDDDRPFERELAGIQRFEPISRSHESQLNILQVGRATDGFYYVMEVADEIGRGQAIDPGTYTPRNLRSELHLHGRLPAGDCLRIGLALTTALGHLHKHGLVHRDIKPSNIVFVNGIPKLADIGLVARAEATMSFVGTEGFLPPEGPGTRQADIFSLGKVLYELSTGHDRQQFPELPTNIIDLPDRLLLGELNEVLIKACHRDPAQRYQTAAEMHADLALLESGRSVVRMRGMERRLRFVQRAGAAVTAFAAIIALGWWWQARQTKIVRSLALEKTRLAETNARLVEENRQRALRRDIAFGTSLLDEGDPGAAFLWFAEALKSIADPLNDEPIHRIRIQQTLKQIPRVLQSLPHDHEVHASAFSADGRRIVTGTDWGYLRGWDAESGDPLWQPLPLGVFSVAQARFTRNGRRVFASSLPAVLFFDETRPTNILAIVEAETGRPLLMLSGTNWVRGDLTPDDRWLVTADTSHAIQVRDATDGSLVSEFKGHTNRILQFQFSTNGNLLASSSEDHSVRLWRLPTGEPLGDPIPYVAGPIALNEDGGMLATVRDTSAGPTNSTVEIWITLGAGKAGSAIEVEGEVRWLGFLSRPEHALFILTDKQCGLFDAASSKRLGKAFDTPPEATTYSVSPDGRNVVFGGPGGVEGVWSLETGERLLPACLRDRRLAEVGFSPDGSRLLAASLNGTATLLSTRLPREDASYRFDSAVHPGRPTTFLEWRRFSPERRYFLVLLKDGPLRLVDFVDMSDQPIPDHEFQGLSPIQWTFDKSGHRLAVFYSGSGTNLVVLSINSGGITNRLLLPHPSGMPDKMVFTSDGTRLITPGDFGQIRIWRTADGVLERSIQFPHLPPHMGSPVVFPDGQSACGPSAETGRFALLDFANGLTRNTGMPPFEITAFCFSSTGDRFASAGKVNWSRVWSSREGKPLTPPLEHGGEVRWVDWSPDDKRLLTAGLTPEVKVWDAATGEALLPPLRLGSKPLETAQWSLDGRLIVARSDENTVRVWDAATGEPVTPVLHHEGYVRMAHLVTSNRLVTISLPDRMRAWDLQPTELTAEILSDYAKLVSGRQLNASGVMLPLKPQELAELCRSLRRRAPQLFQ